MLLSAELNDVEGPVMVVGDPPMVLAGAYDPGQLWFDFMRGTIFQQPGPIKSPTIPIWTKIWQRHKIGSTNDSRQPYLYSRDIPQFVLPFIEFKKVSNRQAARLEDKEWPAWGRNSKGEMLSLDVGPQVLVHMENWLLENCVGRFRVQSRFVTFERERDYVAAMLRFRGHHD